VTKPPVFLLGFWRSGTTLLHELFCCDPQFGFPSTYACLNPFHFLLTERWTHELMVQQQVRRPMDEMLYSWASPQEDEFALLALAAPSPYAALLIPSLMRDPVTLLSLSHRSREEQNRWESALRTFLRLLTVQQRRTILLKSPSHGFKLPILPALFPRSRYIVIERNPYEVFASNLKLWGTMLDLYSLESISTDEVETFVLEAYVLHEAAIAQGMTSVAPRSLAKVRYEDLVADPVGQMGRLYSELGMCNFETARPQLERYAAKAAKHKRNQLLLSKAQKARIDTLWGSLIREKGYSWPGAEENLPYLAIG